MIIYRHKRDDGNKTIILNSLSRIQESVEDPPPLEEQGDIGPDDALREGGQDQDGVTDADVVIEMADL